MRIVFATKNPGKLRELNELAAGNNGLEFVLAPDDFEAVENGSTFLENAMIKARIAAQTTHSFAVADDSGIEVDALDGRPGIHSARYWHGDDRSRCLRLLEEMKDMPEGKRDAAFVCAMALSSPTGQILHTTFARWRGVIAFAERGGNGFGFDPIFFLPDEGVTSAELSPSHKNRISHRGQAFGEMLSYLKGMTIPYCSPEKSINNKTP